MSAIGEFSDWLATTGPSRLVQDISWIVPATQTLHILALAVVYFAMVQFGLQIMGVLSRPDEKNWANRALTRLWWGLGVLAVSGLVLVIGEPRRELMSWPFRIKILLIIVASLLTLMAARHASREPSLGVRVAAVSVLTCWTLIVIAGRWIAYINFGDEEGL